jgi:hypothetical protein
MFGLAGSLIAFGSLIVLVVFLVFGLPAIAGRQQKRRTRRGW